MIGKKDLERAMNYAQELAQDKRTKIYLSGPVTTYNNDEYARQEFCNLQAKLQAEAPEDYLIVNPVDFNMTFEGLADMTWRDFMACDILVLNSCDWIYMMEGWEISEGAITEKNFAVNSGIRVINHLFSFNHHAPK